MESPASVRGFFLGAPSMGTLLWVKVPPHADHREQGDRPLIFCFPALAIQVRWALSHAAVFEDSFLVDTRRCPTSRCRRCALRQAALIIGARRECLAQRRQQSKYFLAEAA